MARMASLIPPTAPSLSDTGSTLRPLFSAKRVYMRTRSPAKRAASSPPVPARISRMALRSSRGSLGVSNSSSSASSAAIAAGGRARAPAGGGGGGAGAGGRGRAAARGGGGEGGGSGGGGGVGQRRGDL